MTSTVFPSNVCSEISVSICGVQESEILLINRRMRVMTGIYERNVLFFYTLTFCCE